MGLTNLLSQGITEKKSSAGVQVSDSADTKPELSSNKRLLLRRSLLYSPWISSEFDYLPSINFGSYPAVINPNGNASLSLKIQSDLNYSIHMMRQFNSKYDMGVFGKILVYTNAAAALGLAAYHVYKYEIRKKK